jgi:hypothetical protein
MTINHEELIDDIYIVAYYDVFIIDYLSLRKYYYSYGNSVATYSRIIQTSCIYEKLQVKNMGSA